MILYADTSAVVPLLIAEPTSQACGELWDAADVIVATRLLYVEASAALAQAQRLDRISPAEQREALSILDELWSVVDVIELGEGLMTAASTMAMIHGLQGYDATHCAAAVALKDDELVAASADRRLLSAWRAEGLATCDVGQ